MSDNAFDEKPERYSDGMNRAPPLNMLRITENLENDNTVRLRLDGTISETSFAEVEEALTQHVGNSQRALVVLDMAGVVFMNNDAAKKMVQLRSAHLRIINCSPFIETLLNTVAKMDRRSS